MNDQDEPKDEMETFRVSWRVYLRRLRNWLWRGVVGSKHVLVALLVTVVIAVLIMSPLYVTGCRERGLRLFGALLQLVGFWTVAHGLKNAERQFGRPSWREQIAKYFSEFPTRNGRNISVQATGLVGVTMFSGGRVTKWPSPTMTTEEQLKVVLENLKGLHNQVGEIENSIRDAKHELGTQITERFNELKEGEKQIKEQLKEGFVGGIQIEWWGLVLFIIGGTLASASPEVAHYLFGFPPGCY